MKLNLDQLVEGSLDKWQLDVVEPTREYPTRPPTLADLAALNSVTRGELFSDKGAARLSSLFAADAPPVSDWSDEKRYGFLASYLHAWREWSSKNFQAVAAKAMQVVAAAATGGAAHPTSSN